MDDTSVENVYPAYNQSADLSGSVFLVTGGTGSFGRSVVRRLLDTGVKEVRVLSRDEKKQEEMRDEFRDDRIIFRIGDVRDFTSVDACMPGVDYVFSAAALKQVPSCEFYPLEAVKTNVLGTHNVIRSAVRNKVKCVVSLSTDKAAYPINAMGISKAMMERIVTAAGRELGSNSCTRVCCTRYGNVLGTRGSVIPRWIGQIKEGRNITITDPSMSRFVMTMDDAIDLVFYAWAHCNNGDTFISKAKAATLATMASAVNGIFGRDGIDVIGVRHGEKNYETLVTAEEMSVSEDLGRYIRIPCDTRTLNYKNDSVASVHANNIPAYTSDSVDMLSVKEFSDILMSSGIVPHSSLIPLDSRRKTVLVFGSAGMLGHVLSRYLRDTGKYNVVSCVRSSHDKNELCVDLRNTDDVSSVIRRVRPDIVVNAAGLLIQACERCVSDAIRINALLPRFLDSISDTLGFKLIHVSTDCVFSGNSGKYTVDSIPDANSVYGRTKCLGELSDTGSLTVRTSIIGPELKKNGTGLFSWFMRQTGSVSGYCNALWSGVTTLELSKFIDYAIDKDLAGLVQLSMKTPISKYRLLRLLARIWGKNDIRVVLDDSVVVDKSLVGSEFDGYTVPDDYESMLEELKEWY